tara:strand:+ start:246 stop:590 length:345 start_codon:yes stop_codon:yes gene_type:complete
MDSKHIARKILIASKHSTLKRMLSAGSTALLTLFAYLKQDIIPQEILFVLIWLLLVLIIELSVIIVKYFAFCEAPLAVMERRYSDVTGSKKSSSVPSSFRPPDISLPGDQPKPM